MASTYLTRTMSGNSNQKKFTISVWVKRSKISTNQMPIMGVGGGANYATNLYFQSSDKLDFWNYFNGSYAGRKTTTRLLRDINGWYHIVVAVDTTSAQSTADDRIKIYINGERQTSFSTSSNPAQDQTFEFNSGSLHEIGRNGDNNHVFDGLMSHFHFCDGYQYQASDFGETDATTGEWKIKTSPNVSYGSNGFWILKDGNSVTDSSPNSNNFTVASGTLTNMQDNPSNVFCTMNYLDNYYQNSTFSNNNNTVQTVPTGVYTWNTGSLGMTSGKYYYEVKYAANSNSSIYNLIGIADRVTDSATDVLGLQTDCNNYGYYSDTGQSYANNVTSSYGNTYGVGDIIGVAIDLDNSKIYWSKNGTWQNSGDPTSGSTGTGAVSITAVSNTLNGYYLPASGDYGGTQGVTNQHNFGNGYFGTTAVSSAGTNASGVGIFEYDVPNGYTAISTKGFNL